MKRKLYHIFLWCAALVIAGGCNETVFELHEPYVETQKGKIVLRVTADDLPMTRATEDTPDTPAERLIKHLDVVIFNSNTGAWEHHERVDVADIVETDNYSNEGTLVLEKAKEDFESGTKYYVYIIANSTAVSEAFEKKTETSETGLENLDDLREMTQTDNAIHLTGINYGKQEADIEAAAEDEGRSSSNIPEAFLMDGGAYEGETEPMKTVTEGSETLSVPDVKPVTLNDGNQDSNIRLTVNLRRAAAKFIATLTAGDLIVSFNEGEGLNQAGYYIKNLPVDTRVIRPTSNVDIKVKQESSSFTKNEFFVPTDRKIVVTGYVYAHSWGNESLGEAVRLIVNIPMTYYETNLAGEIVDANGMVTDSANGLQKTLESNFYHVPLTLNKAFRRNTCYEVEVEVNAKGNDQQSQAVELTGITYDAVPWTVVGVDVGTSNDNVPRYLTLTEYEHEYYNKNIDEVVEYSTSAAVEVEVVNYWFVDKFGDYKFRYRVETDDNGNPVKGADGNFVLDPDANGNSVKINDEYFGEPTGQTQTVTKQVTLPDGWGSYDFDYESWMAENDFPEDEFWDAIYYEAGEVYTYEAVIPIYDEYVVTADKVEDEGSLGLSGHIMVDSELPENNTIRYIEVRVTNNNGTPDDTSDDVVRTVIYEQYPLVYITNQQGYYSYREDFTQGNSLIPTTYKNRNSTTHNIIGKTASGYSTNGGSCYFRSKVAVQITSGANKGHSDINYYTATSADDGGLDGAQNARMYKVVITASNGTYTLGNPRLTPEGYTDGSEDNKKMVAPAFMTASRLGVLTSSNLPSGATAKEEEIKKHCYNYVETYIDENNNVIHLNDWRLPTEEELKIIVSLQGTANDSADAIDYLLNAQYYYCAGGTVENDKMQSGYGGTTSVRCIRNAYVEPKQEDVPGSDKYTGPTTKN